MAVLFPSPARLAGALIFLVMLGACATPGQNQVYDPISDPRFQGPTLKAARSGPNAFVGTRVRWGGTVARVENRRDETWVEVVEHPLWESGRPRNSSDSEGRFVAQVPGFLDPAIYSEGRQVTVFGTLRPGVRRTIGEYPYEFPVVAVEKHRLWEPVREDQVIYHYDPFWDPFWSGSSLHWGFYPGFYYRHR